MDGYSGWSTHDSCSGQLVVVVVEVDCRRRRTKQPFLVLVVELAVRAISPVDWLIVQTSLVVELAVDTEDYKYVVVAADMVVGAVVEVAR